MAQVSDSTPLNKEIREYLTAEMPNYLKAEAILSALPIQPTIANTVIKLSFEGFPVNQFSTEKEAREWLKTFL